MRILVIGSGGREHALVRALSREADERPRRPGQPRHRGPGRNPSGHAAVPDRILALARKLGPDLVVIGPEAPLVAGAADALREAGIGCFGPGRGGGQDRGLEVLRQAGHGRGGHPDRGLVHLPDAAPRRTQALAAFGPPYVVKDDALAAGKGVLVTADLAAARAHARACGTVVIEEFLDGPEVSLFAVTDGVTAVPLLPAQDFKRARDGDQGPNTGGMGAYAPLPWAPA